jgi:hypothetical protein
MLNHGFPDKIFAFAADCDTHDWGAITDLNDVEDPCSLDGEPIAVYQLVSVGTTEIKLEVTKVEQARLAIKSDKPSGRSKERATTAKLPALD